MSSLLIMGSSYKNSLNNNLNKIKNKYKMIMKMIYKNNRNISFLLQIIAIRRVLICSNNNN